MATRRHRRLAPPLERRMSPAVTIVDYGVGNLRSLLRMFERLQVPVALSGDPESVAEANRLVLPGVGAFDAAMQKLRGSGLEPALRRAALERRIPVMGVCLGMQLLGTHSEEGVSQGLGWIDAETVRLTDRDESGGPLRMPHMGWASVRAVRDDPVLSAEGPPRFYFVHSYTVRCASRYLVLGESRYGGPFTAAIRSENLWGFQFHPEKSHRFGMDLLQRFAST